MGTAALKLAEISTDTWRTKSTLGILYSILLSPAQRRLRITPTKRRWRGRALQRYCRNNTRQQRWDMRCFVVPCQPVEKRSERSW